MIKNNFSAGFTITGLIIISFMFFNIVNFTAHQNINNNDVHVISAFGG